MPEEHHGVVTIGEILITLGALGALGAIVFGMFFRTTPEAPTEPTPSPSITASASLDSGPASPGAGALRA